MATTLRHAGPLVLVILTAATLVAQTPAGPQPGSPPAPPTGLIVGQTLDGTTGKPAAGAVVSITRAPLPGAAPQPVPAALGGPTRVVSDRDGRFMFRDLAAGAYSLTASKAGFADAVYGRHSATGTGSQLLMLRDGERLGDVGLSLWRYATLGGTVVDEAGEPVVNIQVRVLKRAVVGGSVKFTQFGNMPSTDDRGVWRAAALAPGDYVVAIVTTQTTVPTSLQDAFATANKAGASQEFQRELDRSRGLFRGNSLMVASGQRVGAWLLETPFAFSGAADVTAPPIAGGKVFVYPSVFYPAAATPSKATIVRLGAGEERTAIDLQLKPVVTSRISGVLTGPNGPEVHTSLDLMPAGADEVQRDYDLAAGSTTTDGTGAFMFLGVTPGAYTIRALKVPARPVTPSSMTTVIQTGTSTISSGGGPSTPAPIPAEPTYWAAVPVSVGDADVTGLSIAFRTGARLSGRVVFDGSAQPPTGDRLVQGSVTIESADARTTSANQFQLARGVIDSRGQFNTYQLPAGHYVVRAGAFPNWTFKGAFLNGRDVSDAPLELGSEDIGDVVVTYTDRPTELAGAVHDEKGLDGTAAVLVFPAQTALWRDYGPTPRRFKSVRAGTDGVYRVPGLPPGDYLVIALRADAPADWQDSKLLEKLAPIATRVTIADGAKQMQDLQTKEIR